MDLKKKVDHIINKLGSKKFKEVIEECNVLIKKFPNIFIFYNLCGLAYQGINDQNSAEKLFIKAIEINPKEFGPKNNLANTYNFLGKLEESQNLFEEILSETKNNSLVLANYAGLKKKLNDYNSACLLLEKAVSLDKENIPFYEELASCYQNIGDFEKCKKTCEKIINLNKNNIQAHIIISRQNNYKKDRNNLDDMESLYKSDHINIDEKIKLSFAIGKAFEDLKDFELSFKYRKEGNYFQQSKINYNIKNDEKLFRSIENFFNKNELKKIKKNYNKKQIIFICGLPRSGTTLVEQILSSHKKVAGAGELIYLKKVIDSMFIQDNKIINQNIIKELELENNNLNNKYFDLLKTHNFDEKIITDKAPQNFIWIGFIKIFFPNSKVIHCFRNSKDNFLSLFKNNFASNLHMGWTFDPINIVKFYNLYFDLMNFWKSKYSDFIYDIEYEKLVKDSNTEIQKLIKFCNLEWDENCLNHHKNKTPISTVSMYQARKPIYTDSLNLSHAYTKHLEDYFKLLKN